MKPRGRPPLPPGEARTETVKVRLRPRQLARWKEQAAHAGLSFEAWVRMRVERTPENFPWDVET